MQEYEEVKTSQKNKAYEEKLQEILVMFLQVQYISILKKAG